MLGGQSQWKALQMRVLEKEEWPTAAKNREIKGRLNRMGLFCTRWDGCGWVDEGPSGNSSWKLEFHKGGKPCVSVG